MLRLHKRADWEGFSNDMSNFREEFMKFDHTNTPVEDLWTSYRDKLNTSSKVFIPMKTIKPNQRLPFITKHIQNMMKKRDKLHKKAKQSNSQRVKDKYRSVKAKTEKEIRSSYWKYVEDVVLGLPPRNSLETCTSTRSQDKSSTKRFWSYIKGVRTSTSSVAPLKVNGSLVTEAKSKADALNDQFKSVFTQDNGLPPPDKGPSPHPTAAPIAITEPGVNKLLGKIIPSKAAGPDEINARVLKELKDVISPILTIIFQRSIDSGQVPSDWTKANVAPVFKKGEKYKCSNYRPISLTSICCKLMEHIIASHIMNHLDLHNILYHLQHGFRPNRSCETQLIQLYHDLALNRDNRIQTDLIIMDFAKAFDKVSHSKLIYKLNFYGIQGNTNDWIRSFLSNRTQQVLLDGESSDIGEVTSGVPQGTVLGPILFLIFINDLPEYVHHSTVRLFADDAILQKEIHSNQDAILLQEDIDAVQRWEQDWQMQFNPSKCEVLTIPAAKHTITHGYRLHDHDLERVSDAKYLGVTISNDLKWSKHINTTTNSANRILGMLRRNLRTSSTKLKETAYQALVRPKLEYGSAIWDPHTSKDRHKVEMVQRRAARYVSNRYHNISSVTDMLNTLEWNTLEQRREHIRLTMLYKVANGLVAIPPDTFLTPSTTRTRGNNGQGYRTYHTRTDVLKFSFFPRTIIAWNALPPGTVVAPTLDVFKARLRGQGVN